MPRKTERAAASHMRAVSTTRQICRVSQQNEPHFNEQFSDAQVQRLRVQPCTDNHAMQLD